MVDMRGIALYNEIKLKKKNTGLTENISFIVVLEIFAYKIFTFLQGWLIKRLLILKKTT